MPGHRKASRASPDVKKAFCCSLRPSKTFYHSSLIIFLKARTLFSMMLRLGIKIIYDEFFKYNYSSSQITVIINNYKKNEFIMFTSIQKMLVHRKKNWHFCTEVECSQKHIL